MFCFIFFSSFLRCYFDFETEIENVYFIHLSSRHTTSLYIHNDNNKLMREPMTIFEQVNAFNRSNRQRLVIDRTSPKRLIIDRTTPQRLIINRTSPKHLIIDRTSPQRLIIDRTTPQHLPVYSSLNNRDDSNVELKSLSLDVYATKHLVASGKSILPYSEHTRFDEIVLPSINKDIIRDENRRRRKRKRPPYRKSLFHANSLSTTEADLAKLTAHGTKSESQTMAPMIKDDDTVVSFQRHYAPPPSPSDDEVERLLCVLQDRNQSRPPSRESSIEKDGYIPYRLPVFNRSPQFRRSSTSSPVKDVRSTLSNYLHKYY